ncbi:MAG: acyltransferase, partial [Rhizobacter sp.]|nr:acyltransferase [Rhizobacter sp.]
METTNVPSGSATFRATEAPARSPGRVAEIDALRGVAAMSVVLFHYTTRFNELFQPGIATGWQFRHGHYGVNLFFIISGFVIFMTLQRTSRPMDFVVSRFSRLFPAYWAAIALTFVITHLLGLPHKLVTLPEAVANMIMLHGLFRIPHVDGVYWTLEVELLFYAGMFLLYLSGRLRQIEWFLIALLGVRIAYDLLERFAGISLPWTLYRLLILQYLPWFGIGIALYMRVHPTGEADRKKSNLILFASICTLFLAESLLLATLSCFLGACVYLAATGRLAILRHPLLVWLGTISYPLYLLHENIGWSIELRALDAGLPFALAASGALVFALLISHLLSRTVEQPAMRWLRE